MMVAQNSHVVPRHSECGHEGVGPSVRAAAPPKNLYYGRTREKHYTTSKENDHETQRKYEKTIILKR